MIAVPYGLRVVGHQADSRRLVDHAAAFAAYAQCDDRAEISKQAFLTYFVFGNDFKTFFEGQRSERNYTGPCGASWSWWDIDRTDDISLAQEDTKKLCGVILDRYREFDEDDLLVFHSGSKGFHVGLPLVWKPVASAAFNTVARAFALEIATLAGITIDTTIYSKTRLFRAPNSRHAKTGRYKRRFSLREINHLRTEALVERSQEPEAFDIPVGPLGCERAAQDWLKASQAAKQGPYPRVASTASGSPRLTAFARRFIRDGEFDPGQRAVSTFRVAAEMGEFAALHGHDALVHALLEESALDSGLGETEVRRQIQSGLDYVRKKSQGPQE